MLAKIELDSEDNMNCIIQIIFNSIVTAYYKNDSLALEEILDHAESIIKSV